MKPPISWSQIRPIFEFKAFYVALIIFLVGALVLAIGQLALTGVWKTILVGLGLTLLTSSIVSFLGEAFVRLDVIALLDEALRKHQSTIGEQLRESGIIAYGASRRTFDFGALIDSANVELLRYCQIICVKFLKKGRFLRTLPTGFDLQCNSIFKEMKAKRR